MRLLPLLLPLLLAGCDTDAETGSRAGRVSATPDALQLAPAADSTVAAIAADTTTSALWRDFVTARQTDREPVLPDFSFAGYGYSERPVPERSPGPRLDVTAFGAIPDDGVSDHAAIQAAVDSAVAAGGGTVVLPGGRFLVSGEGEGPLLVRGGGVRVQGRGSGPGGTELLIDGLKADNEAYGVVFRGPAPVRTPLARVVADARRESFRLVVDDASSLAAGARVILHCYEPACTDAYYGDLDLPPQWRRLHEQGFRVHEIHQVRAVRGDTVEFREPLHLDVRVTGGARFVLLPYTHIREVGVEDLTISGRWGEHPERFVHHRDDIHDYGWNGLRFDRVADGWVRRVRFHDLNQGLLLHATTAVTVDSVSFTGKQGHAAVHVRFGYGNLVRDAVDEAGHYHGPGVGYSAAGTVYLRYRMRPGQQIDSHGGSPYATLFDDTRGGGVLGGNGGPLEGYPHHGRHLVLWNFRHGGDGPVEYDFWDTRRRRSATFARPLIVGMTWTGAVRFADAGEKLQVLESPGRRVEPASLFEAQLRLRLGTP